MKRVSGLLAFFVRGDLLRGFVYCERAVIGEIFRVERNLYDFSNRMSGLSPKRGKCVLFFI